MADLVSLAELRTHLNNPPEADNDLLEDLLENVEALFESETGRGQTPFIAAATRTEVRDATGTPELFIDYPINTITSIKLGYDPSSPDETLDVADKNVVVFGQGSRQITRTDGGIFGAPSRRRYIQVVYAHQADLPEDAKLAIKSACAIAYRRRGSEEAQSEQIDGYSRQLTGQLADVLSTDPFWTRAVSAHMRLAGGLLA